MNIPSLGGEVNVPSYNYLMAMDSHFFLFGPVSCNRIFERDMLRCGVFANAINTWYVGCTNFN